MAIRATETGAIRVMLRRAVPADPHLYRAMAADVRLGTSDDRCIFASAGLRTPLAGADPALLAAVEPYAERRLAQRGKSVAALVEGLVSADLLSVPTLTSVARRLAMSPRALQLRLAAEGTSFSAIVDGAQRDRALTLLTTTDTPVSTVATSVGFSSPAVLSRAVRRWTGQSPSDYRRANSVLR